MRTLSICILVSLLSIFKIALAGSAIYRFQSMDPTAHEYFYCTIKNAKDTDEIIALNTNEMISGFEKDGVLQTQAAHINDFYFDAYHDSNKPLQKGVMMMKVRNVNATINCEPGTGGRPVYPGFYG